MRTVSRSRLLSHAFAFASWAVLLLLFHAARFAGSAGGDCDCGAPIGGDLRLVERLLPSEIGGEVNVRLLLGDPRLGVGVRLRRHLRTRRLRR